MLFPPIPSSKSPNFIYSSSPNFYLREALLCKCQISIELYRKRGKAENEVTAGIREAEGQSRRDLESQG